MKKIIALIATAALMSVAVVNVANAQISAEQPTKHAKHHKKHHKVAHKKHHKVARHHHAKKRHA